MKGPYTWASMAVGLYLLCCRYLVGGSAGAVWSAYLAGAAVLLAGAFALALPRALWVLAVRILSGAWLLASPFALGYEGAPAANAMVAGALLVVAGEPLRVIFALSASARVVLLVYGVRTVSPREVSSALGGAWSPEPEILGRRIVECCSQIRATMLARPSSAQTEGCLTGYGSCVDDMITLAAIVAEERAKSGPLRRLKLRMVKGEALHSLARAREVLQDAAVTARVRL